MEDELEFYDDDDLAFYVPPKNQKGFMKLYHYITENLIKHHLSGCEYAVVLLLLRMTVGYHGREEAALSLKFIRERTGYDINWINRAILKLIRRGIIARTHQAKFGRSARYRFIDNIDQWIPIS